MSFLLLEKMFPDEDTPNETPGVTVRHTHTHTHTPTSKHTQTHTHTHNHKSM